MTITDLVEMEDRPEYKHHYACCMYLELHPMHDFESSALLGVGAKKPEPLDETITDWRTLRYCITCGSNRKRRDGWLPYRRGEVLRIIDENGSEKLVVICERCNQPGSLHGLGSRVRSGQLCRPCTTKDLHAEEADGSDAGEKAQKNHVANA